MTNLDSILKSRDVTLSAKVCLVKAMVLPVVVYACESWTIKKAERQRIDAFELWCWRRLLRVPWTERRSNQSILKEISPEYSLEGLMLKLQYFGHLMRRTDSLEKTLMLGKTEGGRRRGQQRIRWLDGITDSMNMSLSKLWGWWWTGRPGTLQSMVSQRVGHTWGTELNWTGPPRKSHLWILQSKERLCCTVDIFNIQKILKAGGQLVKFSPWLLVFPQCDGFRGLQGYLFFWFFFFSICKTVMSSFIVILCGQRRQPLLSLQHSRKPSNVRGKGGEWGWGWRMPWYDHPWQGVHGSRCFSKHHSPELTTIH